MFSLTGKMFVGSFLIKMWAMIGRTGELRIVEILPVDLLQISGASLYWSLLMIEVRAQNPWAGIF